MHRRPVNWMDNPNAERVKRVHQLAGRSAVRSRHRKFLAEGPQSATEAIRAHLGLLELSAAAALHWPKDQTVAEVYFTTRLKTVEPELYGLVMSLNDTVFVAETSDPVMQKMSDAVAHQNIIAVVNMPSEDLTYDSKARLVAALVRVQDPGNAGTIIRAADAAGADYVVATAETVDVYNPKTVRSTAGSLFHVPVYSKIDLAEFNTRFQGQVLAADGYGTMRLDNVDQQMLQKPTVWLFGNEAQGLSKIELTLAKHRVAVPLYGLAESLNVATAATICLYSSAMAQQHQ